LISFSCDKCEKAEYIKESLGCEQPTKTPSFWLEDKEEWWNCPRKFINQSVSDFLEKYDAYNKKLATPPDFDLQSARFNIAVKVFESYLVKFIAMKKGEE
jgi:hypothetical protein